MAISLSFTGEERLKIIFSKQFLRQRPGNYLDPTTCELLSLLLNCCTKNSKPMTEPKPQLCWVDNLMRDAS
jgi:hypothetical protein